MNQFHEPSVGLAPPFFTDEPKGSLLLDRTETSYTASESLTSYDGGHSSTTTQQMPSPQSCGKDDDEQPFAAKNQSRESSPLWNLCYDSQPKGSMSSRAAKSSDVEEMDYPRDLHEHQDENIFDDDDYYFDPFKDHLSDEVTVSMRSVSDHDWIDSDKVFPSSRAVNYQPNNHRLISPEIQYPERYSAELFRNPLPTRNSRSTAQDMQSPSIQDTYTRAEKVDISYIRSRLPQGVVDTADSAVRDILYGAVYNSPGELSHVMNPGTNRLLRSNAAGQSHSHSPLHQTSTAVEDLYGQQVMIPTAGLTSNPLANNRDRPVMASQDRSYSSIQDVYVTRADRDNASYSRNPISKKSKNSTTASGDPMYDTVYSTPTPTPGQVNGFSNPTSNRSMGSSSSSAHLLKDTSISLDTIDTIYSSSGERDNAISFSNFTASHVKQTNQRQQSPRKLTFSLFRIGRASQPKISTRKITTDEDAMESVDYSQLYPDPEPLVVGMGVGSVGGSNANTTPMSMINQIRSKTSRRGNFSGGGLGSKRSASNKKVQMKPDSLHRLEASLTSRASRYQVLSELEETMEPSKAKFQQIKMFFENIAARSSSDANDKSLRTMRHNKIK